MARGGFDAGAAPKLPNRPRRILAYCGRKMVLTMGSTSDIHYGVREDLCINKLIEPHLNLVLGICGRLVPEHQPVLAPKTMPDSRRLDYFLAAFVLGSSSLASTTGSIVRSE